MDRDRAAASAHARHGAALLLAFAIAITGLPASVAAGSRDVPDVPVAVPAASDSSPAPDPSPSSDPSPDPEPTSSSDPAPTSSPNPSPVPTPQPGADTQVEAEPEPTPEPTEPPPPPPAEQLITFELPSSGFVRSVVLLQGSADSGLPVEYSVQTLVTCAVDGAALSLLAPGTCTVTASQPGDDAFLPAPDVTATMAVEPVPQGVDLGEYAVNGTVRALAQDASTGITYLGGDFTQIGVRTGPLAVVDLPGEGDGGLRPESPELLGRVSTVVADDRPGDPGLLVAGQLLAVDGVAVQAEPVTRLRLDADAGRWVVDPGWTVDDPANLCEGAALASWLETPTALFAGGLLMDATPSGIVRLNRVTGRCSRLAPAASPLPPVLQACAGQDYCHGQVAQLAIDPDRGRLVVTWYAITGETSSTARWSGWLSAFDLATGQRAWTTRLQGDHPSWTGHPSGLGVSGDTILVEGNFPFEPSDPENDRSARRIAVDAATGAITQRWNAVGEEHLGDGSVLEPAGACLTIPGSRAGLFPLDGALGGWIWVTSQSQLLCRFAPGTGGLEGEPVPNVALDGVEDERLPVTEHVLTDGTHAILSPWQGIDLATGADVGWHADPGTAQNRWARLTATDHGMVVAGDFAFVRGLPMAGVGALRADLSPDPAFRSPLDTDENRSNVEALALNDGWLLVGGDAWLPASDGDQGHRTLLGIDPRTGDVTWDPGDQEPAAVGTIAVDPVTSAFWVGGLAQPIDDRVALAHFAAPSDGAGALPVPELGCLEGPYVPDFQHGSLCPPAGNAQVWVTDLAFDATGRLYLGGVFGSVDGSPRRGLARLGANGTLDPWAPDLRAVLAVPPGDAIHELDVRSIAPFGDRVLVGGRFCSVHPHPGGGGALSCISPVLVFDDASGSVVRPAGAERAAWFPTGGWWSGGHAIVARASGVVVGLGDVGLVVLDPVTLAYDAPASAPYLNTGWWGRDETSGVFALALPAVTPGSGDATGDAGGVGRLVVGGSIPRWGLRVAGNVLSTGLAATSHLPGTAPPSVRVQPGAQVASGRVPVRLTWTGRPHGVEIDRYEVARSRNGGAWTTLGSVVAPSLSLHVPVSGTVRFRVRAVDMDGVAGPWSAGPVLDGDLLQQTAGSISWRGSWRTVRSDDLSGGSARSSTDEGATATVSVRGRAVALVATVGPSRGRVRVIVDGKRIATVNLAAAATRRRVVVWQRVWANVATRSIRFVVVGTDGRRRVDLDAIAVVR